jgi:hypothetical protein
MPESPDINLTLAASPIIEVAPDGGVTIDVSMSAGGGSGDVVGPASATDNAIARFNGTTGKLIQNSGITIADGATGVLSGTNSGDQNLFGTFAVSGQSNVVADSTNDTLTLVAGTNVTLTTDPTTDSITINATTSGGDVVGPASSTDNALVRFDSTTGKLIQNGQITQSDTGDLASVNSIAMDTTPTGSLTTAGQMMWSADDETLDIQLNGFAMHTGQHVLYHVRNSTGSTIAKGVPVMFAGTTGNSGKLLIQPWNGTGPSTYFMGLTAESLTNGSEGFVIAFGKLNGIQTNGGNYGETWADGEIIYAGTTTGSLTKTQPAAPNPHVQVLAVVHAHPSNGTVFINRTLGSNIKDDEGVTITSLSTGQILVANSAGTVFENKSVSGDATLANTGALTLATVNSNVGSFGSSTAIPAITVNAKGLITAVSTNTVAPAIGNITGLGTNVATALAVNVGTAGSIVVNGGVLGTPSSGTLTSCTGLPVSTGVSGLGTNVATSLANNMAASGTLAILGANIFTGAQVVSVNGAASTPALRFTGSVFTGGTSSTTVPLLDFRASGSTANFSTNGTLLGGNSPSGFTGDIIRFSDFSGTSRFRVDQNGTVYGAFNAGFAGGLNCIGMLSHDAVYASANLPGLSGTGGVSVRSTDVFAWSSTTTWFSTCDLILRRRAAGVLAQYNGANAQISEVYNTFTSATNFERATIGWATNILSIGTEKGSGGGTARALQIITDGTSRINVGAAGEIGLYGVTAVARATTAGAAATFAANTSGIANDTATWGGYTIGQVVTALRNIGILT